MVIKMNAEVILVEATKARWEEEVEKAVDKVKLGMIPSKPRTGLDKWFRRRYYIETNRLGKARRWPRRNKAKHGPGKARRNNRVNLFSKKEVNQNDKKMQTLWKTEDAGRS